MNVKALTEYKLIHIFKIAAIFLLLGILPVHGCTQKTTLTTSKTAMEAINLNEVDITEDIKNTENTKINEKSKTLENTKIPDTKTPEDTKIPDAKIPEDTKITEKLEVAGNIIKPEGSEIQAKKQIEYPALENKIICIDPGHQSIANYGKEPIAPGSSTVKDKMTFGTAGAATKVPEYQLNLEVSLKLKEKLEASNAKIIMTREINEVDVSNVERALLANRNNSDIVVRIHADGIENPEVKGTSVLFPGKEYIHDNRLLESSKSAAKMVLEAMIDNTRAVSRGIIERNDMTGFNWSERTVILIEMGFMTNPAEDKLMNSDEYQDKIVTGILQGLSNYFASVQ